MTTLRASYGGCFDEGTQSPNRGRPPTTSSSRVGSQLCRMTPTIRTSQCMLCYIYTLLKPVVRRSNHVRPLPLPHISQPRIHDPQIDNFPLSQRQPTLSTPTLIVPFRRSRIAQAPFRR
jgi:hypothetical protein